MQIDLESPTPFENSLQYEQGKAERFNMIELQHNLEPEKFMWLWSKYVKGANPNYHCTNVLKGKYSHKLSKPKNPELPNKRILILDELPQDQYDAIYICGVAKQGYSSKKNYPHNLHAALLPSEGEHDEFSFENWYFKVKNAIFLPIPSTNQIPKKYLSLPEEYTTCRIFRWAVNYFNP